MWERWNGWTPEKGFENPGMNSFNHYAFGAVGEWIYNNVAGIQTDTVAFKHIVIHPRPGGGLTHAGMTYQSVRGPIGSYWKIKGDKLTLDVDIPANTTATIYIPTSNVAEVTESGTALTKADGITVRTPIDGTAVCEVGSGTYHFEAPAPQHPSLTPADILLNALNPGRSSSKKVPAKICGDFDFYTRSCSFPLLLLRLGNNSS